MTKIKEARWTLQCGKCNKSQIAIIVPDQYVRTQALIVFKEQFPDWQILPTMCPICQGLDQEINLTWRYENKQHTFVLERGKYYFEGEIKKHPKKVGRMLVMFVKTDVNEKTLKFDTKTNGDGKELAVEKIKEILSG